MNLPLLFEWFISATIHGGLMLFFLLLLRKLFKNQLPPSWRQALWYPALLILILPTLPTSPWSVDQIIKSPLSQLYSSPLFSPSNNLPATASNRTHSPHSNPVNGFEIFAFIWIIGIIFIFSFSIYSYFRTLKIYRNGCIHSDPKILRMVENQMKESKIKRSLSIWTSTSIETPALIDWFEPILILPANLQEKLNEREIRFVIAHELIHLKHYDLAINWFFFLIQSIHWCNPLVWLALHHARIDRELACDDQVLKNQNQISRVDYGSALLKMSNGLQSSSLVLNFFDGKGGLKSRIRAIASLRVFPFSQALIPLLFIGGLLLFSGTRSPVTPPLVNSSQDKELNHQAQKKIGEFRSQLKLAKTAEIKNDPHSALTAYEEGLKKLFELQTDHPEWQPTKIETLLKYITFKADELKANNGIIPPETQLFEIESTLKLALQAEANGKTELSLKRFQLCLDSLNQIKTNFPDWQTETIAFKIQFVTKKIGR